MTKQNKMKLSQVFLLLGTFVVYSCSSVFSKNASMYDTLSLEYIIFFIGVLFCLGLYAILWQKVLSFMPLNKAFLCKSMTIVLILAISYFVFDESITINNVIGTCLIMFGLINLSCQK